VPFGVGQEKGVKQRGGATRLTTTSRPPLIRETVGSDRSEWVRLREALWPGFLPDHDAERGSTSRRHPQILITFVAEAEGCVVGFLEMAYRKYAHGCRSTPVSGLLDESRDAAVQTDLRREIEFGAPV